jgi:hypothetical protein
LTKLILHSVYLFILIALSIYMFDLLHRTNFLRKGTSIGHYNIIIILSVSIICFMLAFCFILFKDKHIAIFYIAWALSILVLFSYMLCTKHVYTYKKVSYEEFLLHLKSE